MNLLGRRVSYSNVANSVRRGRLGRPSKNVGNLPVTLPRIQSDAQQPRGFVSTGLRKVSNNHHRSGQSANDREPERDRPDWKESPVHDQLQQQLMRRDLKLVASFVSPVFLTANLGSFPDSIGGSSPHSGSCAAPDGNLKMGQRGIRHGNPERLP